jgi:hypothetical protein
VTKTADADAVKVSTLATTSSALAGQQRVGFLIAVPVIFLLLPNWPADIKLFLTSESQRQLILQLTAHSRFFSGRERASSGSMQSCAGEQLLTPNGTLFAHGCQAPKVQRGVADNFLREAPGVSVRRTRRAAPEGNEEQKVKMRAEVRRMKQERRGEQHAENGVVGRRGFS